MGRSGGRKMFALIAHFIQHGLRAEEASFEPDAEPVHPRQERAWRLWRKGRLLPQRRHQDHQLFPPPVLIDLSLEGSRECPWQAEVVTVQCRPHLRMTCQLPAYDC